MWRWIVSGAVIWFLCAATFFRLWVKWNPTRQDRNGNWMVAGWHEHSYYDDSGGYWHFENAMAISLVAWLPVTLIVALREGAHGFFRYVMTPVMVPQEFKPLAVKDRLPLDAAMQVGIATVNRIAPVSEQRHAEWARGD